jgi:hypothetical protein
MEQAGGETPDVSTEAAVAKQINYGRSHMQSSPSLLLMREQSSMMTEVDEYNN